MSRRTNQFKPADTSRSTELISRVPNPITGCSDEPGLDDYRRERHLGLVAVTGDYQSVIESVGVPIDRIKQSSTQFQSADQTPKVDGDAVVRDDQLLLNSNANHSARPPSQMVGSVDGAASEGNRLTVHELRAVRR